VAGAWTAKRGASGYGEGRIVGSQRREGPALERSKRLASPRLDQLLLRHVVPPDQKNSRGREAARASGESALGLGDVVEPPAQHAIQNQKVEVALGEMLTEVHDAARHVPLGPVLRAIRIDLDRPELTPREVLLVACRVPVAPDEEDSPTRVAHREEGKNLFLEHAPILGLEAGLQADCAARRPHDHPAQLIGRVAQARQQALLLQRGLLSVSIAIVTNGFAEASASLKWITWRKVS